MSMALRTMAIASLGSCALCGLLRAEDAFAPIPRQQVVEASFPLKEAAGNPFDYRENDVLVHVADENGTEVAVPAFYDGDNTWRFRYSPGKPGRYEIAKATLNGLPIDKGRFSQTGFRIPYEAQSAFVRLSGDRKGFTLDGKTAFYPVGMNLGWTCTECPSFEKALESFKENGINWTRIWMCHWDGMDLDWHGRKDGPGFARFDLEVARKWDSVVMAASKSGVRLQMVFQHHGQLSTRVNANWHEHPWNKANGGWLEKAEDFFTDSKAKDLCKAKYRYIVARWGCASSIMAWELFNEVEWTDAMHKGKYASVGEWHSEMTSFIRAQDIHRHMVTSSSDIRHPEVFKDMDYYQPHIYQHDLGQAISSLDSLKLGKAYFWGEIGSDPLHADDGSVLHFLLWRGLMSKAAGAPQYWTWDNCFKKGLLGKFKPFTAFIAESGMDKSNNLERLDIVVACRPGDLAPLYTGPGGLVEPNASETPIQIDSSRKSMDELSRVPQYYGKGELKFIADYQSDGFFSVGMYSVEHSGAEIAVTVDGTGAALLKYPCNREDGKDYTVNNLLTVPISRGRRAISFRNAGPGWVRLNGFEFSPMAPPVQAIGKGNGDSAIVWLRNLNNTGILSATNGRPVKASIRIPSLRSGRWLLSWWDTHNGKTISSSEADAGEGGVQLETPEISEDIALWIRRK